MKYYSILKGKVLIGIGKSKQIPESDKLFTYREITKLKYDQLIKTVFNAKQ